MSVAWSVWGLGAAFYLIAFYQRVAPAVITNELMMDFKIGAAALGNLSAFYFYSYVAMQIPTGIIADRWGPRRLLALGAAVAALGTLIFAFAPNLFWANVGRLLIGGSVAVAFVGMMKIASHWFVLSQFALVSGFALFIGIIGAVFAGVPLRLLVSLYGWRPVMLVSALATLVVSIAIWVYVRDDPAEKGYASHFHAGSHSEAEHFSVLEGLREVLRYRNTWLLFFIPGGMVGCVLTFSGLWGVPFLTTHYQMTTTQAAAVTSTLLIAWAVGGPVFGALSDKLGRRKPLYVAGCISITAGWAVLLLIPGLPYTMLMALLIGIGFFSGSMITGFAFAKESVPAALSGTISGVSNMGVMMGPMILQPAVGWMLDRNWGGVLEKGVRVYDFAAYRAGFSLMLAWAVLSILLILLTRETYCKQSK